MRNGKTTGEPGRPSAVAHAPTWRAQLVALGRHRTLQIALAGTLLYWASLAPLEWWPLGWIAAVPWLWLARLEALPGRRPYGAIYLAGIVFWLATNHWMRLPHWTTIGCWIALAFYIGAYIPLCVGLTRIAVHRLGASVVVAGPIAWVACDQLRATVMTGFPLSSLCHGQYRQVELIQAADLAGEFGVTFLMVLAAAAIARALPVGSAPAAWRWLPIAPAVIAATYAYGAYRLNNEATTPGPVISLIQGSIDSEFKYDPTKGEQIYDHYLALSHRAVAADPKTALVVWPETMFPYALRTVGRDANLPSEEELSLEQLRRLGEAVRGRIWETVQGSLPPPPPDPSRTPDRPAAADEPPKMIVGLKRPLLLGIGAHDVDAAGSHRFNSVLFVDEYGMPRDRYDKQHRVVFGEFIPFADWLPFLYKLSPLTGGIEEGREPRAIRVAGVRLSPSVCYESVIGRLIRRHVVELGRRGEEPDVLVNVTNDGWFWGSSELDLHLACGVFRAVECRKPMLIAANTGFSAHIDSDGRILAQGPRRDSGYINAAVRLDSRRSGYVRWGDWPANVCVGLAAVTLAIELSYRRRAKRREKTA